MLPAVLFWGRPAAALPTLMDGAWLPHADIAHTAVVRNTTPESAMPKTTPSRRSLPQNDFTSQYGRVLEATGCVTQNELAALLEVRQSSISDAKRRNSMPAAWLIKLFEKKRINPEWIRAGLGVKIVRLGEETDPAPADPALGRNTTPDNPPDELPADSPCAGDPAADALRADGLLSAVPTDELLAELMRRVLKRLD